MRMAAAHLFTIGYSGYRYGDFLQTLDDMGITALVDVRQWAKSTTFEQYNAENLRPALREMGISHLHLGRELGARPSDLALYTNGRADFDKVMESSLFNLGYQRLLDGIDKNFRICLMCSQKDPLICHRAVLIARCFELRNPEVEIFHLNPGKSPESQRDFGARLMKAQNLYDHNLLLPDFEQRKNLAYRRQGQAIAWKIEKAGN